MKLPFTHTLPIADTAYDLACITSTGTEVEGFDQQKKAVWKATLAYYRSGVSPLVGICIHDREGNVILNRNIGHIDGSQNQIAQIDTPICLFSVSKMITAVLIHKLAELGKLSLSDKVSHYLPDYTGDGRDSTTIQHLLTHHGGIPRLEGSEGERLDPTIGFDRDAIMNAVYRAPLFSEDGATMSYHALSAGYLLGEIAEVVSGDSLETLLQTYIAQPMDMNCMHYGLPKDQRADAAKHYLTGLHPKLGADLYLNYVLSGGLQTVVDFTNDERFYDAFCPAANIFTTTENASRFMYMLLNDGRYGDRQILLPSTVQAIRHAPYGWRMDHTLLVPMRYGQGVMRGANPVGLFGPFSAKSFGHLGFTNILCWADPKRGISVSFMNTGKAIVGTHLPALANLTRVINKSF